MRPGEYAVHASTLDGAKAGAPHCTIFGSLAEAEAYAEEQLTTKPDLQYSIYDHHGFAKQPIRELRGRNYKAPSEISPRVRRWLGSGLLGGGLLLILFDWINDFSLSWPAMIGVRMLLPGIVLLLTEAVIVLQASRAAAHGNKRDPA
jgi:hypothetical protein